MKKNKFSAALRRVVSGPMEHMRAKKNGTWLLYMLLRIVVIGFAIHAAFAGRFESQGICALVLVLFLLPSLVEKHFKIVIPSALEKIILLFAFAAEILGEIQGFYVMFPWWDTMLHTMNGFLCAAIGFAIIDLLNESPNIRFKLSPLYCALAAFCFSMTVGVVWEFFEFGMDYFFHLDMQKDTVISVISSVKLDPTGGNTPVLISGIHSVAVNGQELNLGGYLDIGLFDTMKDLLVNFVGALVFCFIGYKYSASHGKDKFASNFIPHRVTEEQQGEGLGAEQELEQKAEQEAAANCNITATHQQ